MVALYDRYYEDPRIKQTDDASCWLWLGLIGLCNTLGRDTLTFAEVTSLEATRPDVTDVPDSIKKLRDADLLRQHEDGSIHVLARLDLWAFDDEAWPDEPEVT